MRVLFVTSECAGLFKRGGLGDVSRALPEAFVKAGVEVGICLPYYKSIPVDNVECLGEIPVKYAGGQEIVFVFKTVIAVKVPIFLFRHPLVDEYDGNGSVDRFGLYALAVAKFYCQADRFGLSGWDIIHIHDWHAGLVPMLVGEERKTETNTTNKQILQITNTTNEISKITNPNDQIIILNQDQSSNITKIESKSDTDNLTTDKPVSENRQLKTDNKHFSVTNSAESLSPHTIFTVHNLMYQGKAGEGLADKLNISKDLFHFKDKDGKLDINMLREGLEYSDIITTVSPTYAQEIQTKEFGQGLEDVFVRRSDSVVGIINGIDTNLWNPESDEFLPVKYTVSNFEEGKREAKKELFTKLKTLSTVRDRHSASSADRDDINTKSATIPGDEQIPLIGFIGRIEPNQKGLDILMDAVRDRLSEKSVQLVILGTGLPDFSVKVQEFVNQYPDLAYFANIFDEKLAHLIYAGADIMAIPSKFEPCGLVQMIAMRYGTIPVVRATGGLKDTVKDGETGFVFEKYEAGELLQAINRSIDVWRLRGENKPHFSPQSGASRGAGSLEAWSPLTATRRGGESKARPLRRDEFIKTIMNIDWGWERSAGEYISLYKKISNS